MRSPTTRQGDDSDMRGARPVCSFSVHPAQVVRGQIVGDPASKDGSVRRSELEPTRLGEDGQELAGERYVLLLGPTRVGALAASSTSRRSKA